MKILAIEKDIKGFNSEDFKQLLKEEAKHVWKLYEQGIIREIYFNQHHNAILVFEENSLEAALKITQEFPLVKNKLIEFEFMELNPYSGFKRLFI